MENKARIIEEDGVYRYFDMDGRELHEGDTIIYASSGAEKKLYLTEGGMLGTDATNPLWIEKGKAVPCEFGLYPLERSDVGEVRLKENC